MTLRSVLKPMRKKFEAKKRKGGLAGLCAVINTLNQLKNRYDKLICAL